MWFMKRKNIGKSFCKKRYYAKDIEFVNEFGNNFHLNPKDYECRGHGILIISIDFER